MIVFTSSALLLVGLLCPLGSGLALDSQAPQPADQESLLLNINDLPTTPGEAGPATVAPETVKSRRPPGGRERGSDVLITAGTTPAQSTTTASPGTVTAAGGDRTTATAAAETTAASATEPTTVTAAGDGGGGETTMAPPVGSGTTTALPGGLETTTAPRDSSEATTPSGGATEPAETAEPAAETVSDAGPETTTPTAASTADTTRGVTPVATTAATTTAGLSLDVDPAATTTTTTTSATTTSASAATTTTTSATSTAAPSVAAAASETPVRLAPLSEDAAPAASSPSTPLSRHRPDPGLGPTDNKPSSRRTGVPDLEMLENPSKPRKGVLEPEGVSATEAAPATRGFFSGSGWSGLQATEPSDRHEAAADAAQPQATDPTPRRKPTEARDPAVTPHPSSTSTVFGVIILVLLIAVIGFFLVRKVRDGWYRRHYRKMDFLVDGMYNL